MLRRSFRYVIGDGDDREDYAFSMFLDNFYIIEFMGCIKEIECAYLKSK